MRVAYFEVGFRKIAHLVSANNFIPCNPPGFASGKKGALLWNMLSRLHKLHRVSADIMVIGVENSSVSDLIVQNIHTL